MSASLTPSELLFMRLRQLGAIDFQGTGDSDDARAAILSLLCAEAVAGRTEDKKLHTFRSLYAVVFGQALDSREKAAKRAKGRAAA